MATNRKGYNKSRIQLIWSEPFRIMIGEYLTPKGERLLAEKLITKKEAWKKYGKKRYRNNPNAKLLKVIKHPL